MNGGGIISNGKAVELMDWSEKGRHERKIMGKGEIKVLMYWGTLIRMGQGYNGLVSKGRHDNWG